MKINQEKLSIAMAENELNFSQLSNRSGVSRPTLSYINNGKRCRPDIAAKIAKALRVPVTAILETTRSES